jgi:hypothetical protein
MPKVFNEDRHAAEFILFEVGITYSRDNIIIAAGSGIVKPGTALGQITASGKYKPSTATGSDGAQTAKALNIEEVDATSADVIVAALTRVSEVNGKLIAYDATVDDATKRAAKAAQLAAAGIIVR